MGRWSFSNKKEADYLKKITIWWLKKNNFLTGSRSGDITWTSSNGDNCSVWMEISTMDRFIRFQYAQTEYNGERKEFNYEVSLTTTPCNYGGRRYWFICPLIKNGENCGRRVGVLYKGGDYFGCRHCYKLTYSSKNENKNSKYYPLFRTLTFSDKIKDLKNKIKRPFYAGEPTKKQRKLYQIFKQRIATSALLNKKKVL